MVLHNTESIEFPFDFGTSWTAKLMERVTPCVRGRLETQCECDSSQRLRAQQEIGVSMDWVDTAFVMTSLFFLLAREGCGRHCATLMRGFTQHFNGSHTGR